MRVGLTALFTSSEHLLTTERDAERRAEIENIRRTVIRTRGMVAESIGLAVHLGSGKTLRHVTASRQPSTADVGVGCQMTTPVSVQETVGNESGVGTPEPTRSGLTERLSSSGSDVSEGSWSGETTRRSLRPADPVCDVIHSSRTQSSVVTELDQLTSEHVSGNADFQTENIAVLDYDRVTHRRCRLSLVDDEPVTDLTHTDVIRDVIVARECRTNAAVQADFEPGNGASDVSVRQHPVIYQDVDHGREDASPPEMDDDDDVDETFQTDQNVDRTDDDQRTPVECCWITDSSQSPLLSSAEPVVEDSDDGCSGHTPPGRNADAPLSVIDDAEQSGHLEPVTWTKRSAVDAAVVILFLVTVIVICVTFERHYDVAVVRLRSLLTVVWYRLTTLPWIYLRHFRAAPA